MRGVAALRSNLVLRPIAAEPDTGGAPGVERVEFAAIEFDRDLTEIGKVHESERSAYGARPRYFR